MFTKDETIRELPIAHPAYWDDLGHLIIEGGCAALALARAAAEGDLAPEPEEEHRPAANASIQTTGDIYTDSDVDSLAATLLEVLDED